MRGKIGLNPIEIVCTGNLLSMRAFTAWFVTQGHNMIDRYFKMTGVKVDHDMSLLGRQGSCPGGCIS